MNLYRYTVFKGADPTNLVAMLQIQAVPKPEPVSLDLDDMMIEALRETGCKI